MIAEHFVSELFKFLRTELSPRALISVVAIIAAGYGGYHVGHYYGQKDVEHQLSETQSKLIVTEDKLERSKEEWSSTSKESELLNKVVQEKNDTIEKLKNQLSRESARANGCDATRKRISHTEVAISQTLGTMTFQHCPNGYNQSTCENLARELASYETRLANLQKEHEPCNR